MPLSPSEQSLPESAPPPRKRGAPRGNKNAWKHGFYSHLFTREEALALYGLCLMKDPLLEILFMEALSELAPYEELRTEFRIINCSSFVPQIQFPPRQALYLTI